MNHKDVLNIYSEDYAKEYNERFLLNPFSKLGSDFELSLLKDLIPPQTNWLDIGCGTGYFLSQFPGIKRAGLDLSPFMLEQAKRVNSDALFFKEGDFRNEFPEWKAKWSLVSCMWGAYSYLESISELEQVILNMITWTSAGGNIFLPVMDMEDFRFDVQIEYEQEIEIYGGKVQLNGFTWSWLENESGVYHSNMIAPHTEHIIKLMAPFFETIELVRYRPYRTGWVSRKALVAKGKVADGKKNEAKIIRHAIPPPVYPDPQNTSLNKTNELSSKQLIGELFRRIKSGQLMRSALRKMKDKLTG